MYPKLEIKLDGIIDNLKFIKKLCNDNNVKLSVVTKLFSGNKEVISSLVENGADCICEAKIGILKEYQDINVQKWLIRMPMLSEIQDVVKYSDVSLNSELSTIRAINEEAKKQGKVHKIILMYEIGDLREGCLKAELKDIVSECLKYKNVELYGIGSDLSCFGEILPSEENMHELVNVVNELETEFGIKFKVISGGNSSSYQMLMEKKLPAKINNLRLGESISFGRIPCMEKDILNLHHDNFILKAQIIELKEKPSVPWGMQGNTNALGEHTTFVDRGIRKRAILGLGRQDSKLEGLKPVDEKIFIIGGSSDHTIVDVTDSEREYKVGDIIEFKMNYASVLQAMTNQYVEKDIKK